MIGREKRWRIIQKPQAHHGQSPRLSVIGGTLAFSAAALLCLGTEELLMKAHEIEEKPISTLVLIGGFLAFWSIQLVGI